MSNDKSGSILLLAVVFAANFVETQSENWIEGQKFLVDSDIGVRCAAAFQWLEGRAPLDFDNSIGDVAAYSSSVAYFFIFPVLAVGVAIALLRRSNPVYLRCFAHAIALSYVISLPFYLLYPIPERWAFPESGALLLSDHVSSRLIEIFRPISAIDNCFPSSHVSITVILVLAVYTFQMPLKHCIFALGLAIIVSTYVIGIHWLPDIGTGVVLGAVSWLVVIAFAIKRSTTSRSSAPVLPAQ
jgi:membrane-associated phospholipid phosphatase